MEPSADGVGKTTPEEDTTTERASTRSHSRARAKEKEKESVLTAEQRDTTQGIVPIHKRAKARARVSKENVTTAEKKDTLQENAPKEKATKAKEKEKLQRQRKRKLELGRGGVGRGRRRSRRVELAATRRRENGVKHRISRKGKCQYNEEGYKTVRRARPRTVGQFMPEMFAVEAEKP